MDITCGFCKQGQSEEKLGTLHWTRIRGKLIAAHQKCMQYSSALVQYKFDNFGGFILEDVEKELKRGKKLKCNSCHISGATAGCAIRSCRRTYHFTCATIARRLEKAIGSKREVLYRIYCCKEHEALDKKEMARGTSAIEDSSSKSDYEEESTLPVTADEAQENATNRKKLASSSDTKPHRGRPPKGKMLLGDSQNIKLPRGRPASTNMPRGRQMKRPRGTQQKTKRDMPTVKTVSKGELTMVIKLPGISHSADTNSEAQSKSLPQLTVRTSQRKSPSRTDILDGRSPGTSEKEKATDHTATGETRLKPKTAWVDRLRETQVHSTKFPTSTEVMNRQNSERPEPCDDLDTASERDLLAISPSKESSNSRAVKRRSSLNGKDGTKSSSKKVKRNSESPKSQDLPRKAVDERGDKTPTGGNREVSVQNLDGTETEARQGPFLTPEASNYDDSGSEGTEQDREDINDPKLDANTVFLLIPSVLNVPGKEIEALHRDLDIKRSQSIIWPGLDKMDVLKDKHLPHFMLDIVTSLGKEDWSEVQTILHKVSTKEYDSILQHLSEKLITDITKEALNNTAKKLEEFKDKPAYLVFRRYQSMAVLVIPLSSSQKNHKSIISSLNPVFECKRDMRLKSMFTKPKKTKEELERLRNWFMTEIRSSFQIDSYPRQAVIPIEKILYDENCTSEVVSKLTNNLSALQQKLSFQNDPTVAIVGINGVNKQVLKYKAFVKRAIESLTEDTNCKDICFIVSVDQGDEIDSVSDILPAELAADARIYTAFNPDNLCASCIVIYIPKTDERKDGSDGSLLKDSVSIESCSSSSSSDTDGFILSSNSPSGNVMSQSPKMSRQKSCTVVKTDTSETMCYQPVDVEWQQEKAMMLGLTVHKDIPTSQSGVVSRLETPKGSTVAIRKDGNCYFRAISHVLTGNQREHKAVRGLIYRFLVGNDEVFSRLADCPNYAESKAVDEDGVWATEIEIFATATMLDTDICVYSACGNDSRGDVYKWLTYKPLQNVSPLEGVRTLRNSDKWITYKQVENVVSWPNYLKQRKTIYLSNIDDHYVPVYKLALEANMV